MAETTPRPEASSPSTVEQATILLLETALLVEDNLFIVADAEDLLRRLGAETVIVARSVSEALDTLSEMGVSFAMLDVDLGPETSLPVARALRRLGVPVIFGTGYGDAVAKPDSLEDVPVVVKSYPLGSLTKALGQIPPGGREADAAAD